MVVVALAAAAWTSGTPSRSAAQTMTIGYTSGADTLPLFVAKDEGFFKKHGLDVELLPIANGSTIPAALIGNSVQGGTLSAGPFLAAASEGLDLVIIAAMTDFRKDRQTIGLVVREGEGISTPKDLVGKRLAVPGRNGILHLMLVEWLTRNGVPQDKVSFIEAGFAQMGDMLRAKQIDAAVSIEPLITAAKKRGGVAVIPYFYEVTDRGVFGFIASTRSWADSHPKELKAFRAAITEAMAFIAADEAKAKEILLKNLKLPRDLVLNAPLPSYVATVSPEQLAFWEDLAVKQKVITKRQDVKKLIVP